MDTRKMCKIFALSLGVLVCSQSYAADISGDIVTDGAKSALVSEPVNNLASGRSVTAVSLGQLTSSEGDSLKAGLNSQGKGAPLQVGLDRELPSATKAAIRPKGLVWTTAAGKSSAVLSVTSEGAESVRAGISLKGLSVDGIAEQVTIKFFGSENNTVYGPYHLNKLVDQVSKYDAENMMYWSPVVDGSLIGVEIEIPEGFDTSDVPLTISKISHVSVSLLRKNLNQIGNSGSCNVDVQCHGDDWGYTAAATAKYLFNQNGGTYLCTGTVLNDIDINTVQPYFYTANHCVNSSTVAATVNTYWFFERSSCNAADPTSVQQLTNGAELLSTNSDNDYSLLLLNDSLLGGTTLAGWTTATSDTSITGIHHPAGDLKKISFGSRSGITTYGGNSNVEGGTHHRVVWSTGTTEGGSSGSGLFNDSGRLIGALHGGGASCSNTSAPDWYGRFDLSFSDISAWIYNEGTTGTGDAYEPDDTSADANPIYAGELQTHSLHVEGDVDWVSFTISSTQNITVETSGPGSDGGYADTILDLYNSSGELVTSNDDGGDGLYSKINTELDPGTYFVQARAYNSTYTIESYDILLTEESGSTSTTSIFGGEVTVPPGTNTSLPLSIGGNELGVALQVDVTYDASAFTITGHSNGNDLGSAVATGTNVSSGLYRLVIADFSSNLLNNGELVNLQISVPDDTPVGRYPVNFENVLLSDEDSAALTPESISSGAVDVVLYSTIQLSIGSNGGAPGSDVTLPISINNNDVITGAQLDVSFDPDQFSFVDTSSSGSATILSNLVSDNTVRIVVTDFSGSPLSDGTLLDMNFQVLDDAEDGSYPVYFSNVLVSDADANLRDPSQVNDGELSVSSVVPGDANGDGVINIQDVVGIINIVLGSNGTPGADVNGDGVINIQDVVAAINLILTGNSDVLSRIISDAR